MFARAVFLDKDGTLVENVPYNVDVARIRLTPGAAAGLRRLHDAGYKLVVVTNQAGVARGYFEEAALGAVEARLRELLAEAGVPLAGFYSCPHHPDGVVPAYTMRCACRKPGPGMIRRASRELGLSPVTSWLVGDSLDDIEAGRCAGCRTILLSRETSAPETPPARKPHYVASDMGEAAARILTAGGLMAAATAVPPSAPVSPPRPTSSP